MTWFRRGQDEPQDDGPDPEDRPEALLARLFELNHFINRNAGRLPAESVVAARRVTDMLREVIDTSNERELDIYAVVSIKGILGDYLPTTLRRYLALDPESTTTPRPSGRTPDESLLDQIDSLWSAASDLLDATRARDADALVSQGNFLHTKFTGSDLDL